MTNNTTEYSHIPVCDYSVDSTTERVFKCIAYFIIMFGSLIGNVLVICVVSKNKEMRTVANYLIVNMAVADLLLTVFNMPFTIRVIITGTESWFGGLHGNILCKINSFMQYLSIACSILSLTAIAVDRFLAIMFPLKRYITLQISRGIVTAVWIVGITISSPFLFAQKTVLGSDGDWHCREIRTPVLNEDVAKMFTIVVFMVLYAVPLLVMLILYSFVIHKVWVRKVPGNQSAQNQLHAKKSRKKVLKMLLTVVFLFALCCLPAYIYYFIREFAKDRFPCGPPEDLRFISFFLAQGNSALNPAIYVIFNDNFRKGFRDLLLCRSSKERFANLTNKTSDFACRSRKKVDLLPPTCAKNTIQLASLVSIRKIND